MSRTYMGIDLGSTTTKAVLIDEDGAVLGRGITNTRADYDVATAVARAQCLHAARLTRLGRAAGLDEAAGEALERGFQLAQDLAALDELVRLMREAAEPAMRPALDDVVEVLLREATELFGGGRSRFFRDTVGSRFMQLAEEVALRRGVSFEQLMGLYDRWILVLENTVDDTPFARLVGRALEIERDALTPEQRAAVAGAVEAVAGEDLDPTVTVGTGYGRQRLPFPKEWIRSEILCHGLGAHAAFPNTRTVLDIGGQDTKAIQVNERGEVTGFQMNDRCAAGCGRYLGYVADELNMGVHEIGPLALQARRKVKVSSTCTVFAGVEVRELLAAGNAREDILAGLHRAIVLRAMSLLARSGGVRNELTFTGGVARNPAVVRELTELVHANYGDITINVDPQSIYMGAHGAAMFALRADEGARA